MPVPTRKKNPEGRPGRTLWPEAEYEAIVVDAQEKQSSSSGRDMLVLELEMYSGDDAKKIKTYIVYEDEDGNQTSWCEAMIDALAADHDPESGADPADLIGRQCVVVLIHEDDTYRNKKITRERVDILKRHPNGPVVDEGAAPAQDAAPQAPASAYDDLPF